MTPDELRTDSSICEYAPMLQNISDHPSSNKIKVLPLTGTFLDVLFDYQGNQTVWVFQGLNCSLMLYTEIEKGCLRCFQILEGHTAAVTCIATDWYGRIISGSLDGSLRVWAKDGSCIAMLNNSGEVKCLLIDKAGHIGDHVYAGLRNGTVSVWRITGQASFQLIDTLQGPTSKYHRSVIMCLATGNNGLLIAGTAEGYIHLWLWSDNSFTLVRSIQKFKFPIIYLSIDSERDTDTILVFSSPVSTTRGLIYQLTGLERATQLFKDTNFHFCVPVRPGALDFISISQQQEEQQVFSYWFFNKTTFEQTNNRLLSKKINSSNAIQKIIRTPTGEVILVFSNNDIERWLANGECFQRVQVLDDSSPGNIVYDPRRGKFFIRKKNIVVFYEQNKVYVFNPLISRSDLAECNFLALYSKRGLFITSYQSSNWIALVDYSGVVIHIIKDAHIGGINAVLVDEKLDHIISVGKQDGRICRWEFQTPTTIRKIGELAAVSASKRSQKLHTLIYKKTHAIIYMDHMAHKINCWEMDKQQHTPFFSGDCYFHCLAINQLQNELFTASYNNILVISLLTKQLVSTIVAHHRGIINLSFNEESESLLSTTCNEIKIWHKNSINQYEVTQTIFLTHVSVSAESGNYGSFDPNGHCLLGSRDEVLLLNTPAKPPSFSLSPGFLQGRELGVLSPAVFKAKVYGKPFSQPFDLVFKPTTAPISQAVSNAYSSHSHGKLQQPYSEIQICPGDNVTFFYKHTPNGLIICGSGSNYYEHQLTLSERGCYRLTQLPFFNSSMQLMQLVAAKGSNTHFLALLADGRIAEWGLYKQVAPQFIQLPATIGNKKVIQLAALGFETLALLNDNSFVHWNNFDSAELGVGDIINLSSLKFLPLPPIFSSTNVIQIAGGGHHVLILLSNGQIWGAGENDNGQLGLGLADDKIISLQQAKLQDMHAIQIAAGGNHSLALLSNGQLLAWGANDTGQLGLGHTADQFLPQPVNIGPHRIKQITAGKYSSYALLENGQIFAWGHNSSGELGLNNREDQFSPQLVNLGPHKAMKIMAGTTHVFAVLENGQLFGWGSNSYYELNLPEQDSILTPTPIPMEAFYSASE